MKKPNSKRRDGKLKRTIKKSEGWLKHLPKILTALALLITAIAELIKAIKG
jgi:hypothetical protein